MDAPYKVCVLGPSNAGKTLLCRALANQSSSIVDAKPTVPVRVQELVRHVGDTDTPIQLWDVSGDARYKPYWPILAKEAEGVVLVIDPARPEVEKELEQLYINFAQANRLTTKQCMVVAVARQDHPGSWGGLKGKLSRLQAGQVAVPAQPSPEHRQAALGVLDQLLAGCWASRRDKMERAVTGDAN